MTQVSQTECDSKFSTVERPIVGIRWSKHRNIVNWLVTNSEVCIAYLRPVVGWYSGNSVSEAETHYV